MHPRSRAENFYRNRSADSFSRGTWEDYDCLVELKRPRTEIHQVAMRNVGDNQFVKSWLAQRKPIQRIKTDTPQRRHTEKIRRVPCVPGYAGFKPQFTPETDSRILEFNLLVQPPY